MWRECAREHRAVCRHGDGKFKLTFSCGNDFNGDAIGLGGVFESIGDSFTNNSVHPPNLRARDGNSCANAFSGIASPIAPYKGDSLVNLFWNGCANLNIGEINMSGYGACTRQNFLLLQNSKAHD